jgi:hypothetical protein
MQHIVLPSSEIVFQACQIDSENANAASYVGWYQLAQLVFFLTDVTVMESAKYRQGTLSLTGRQEKTDGKSPPSLRV